MSYYQKYTEIKHKYLLEKFLQSIKGKKPELPPKSTKELLKSNISHLDSLAENIANLDIEISIIDDEIKTDKSSAKIETLSKYKKEKVKLTEELNQRKVIIKNLNHRAKKEKEIERERNNVYGRLNIPPKSILNTLYETFIKLYKEKLTYDTSVTYATNIIDLFFNTDFFNYKLFRTTVIAVNGSLFEYKGKTHASLVKEVSKQKVLGNGAFGIVSLECPLNDKVIDKPNCYVRKDIIGNLNKSSIAREIIISQYLTSISKRYFVECTNVIFSEADGKPVIFYKKMDGTVLDAIQNYIINTPESFTDIANYVAIQLKECVLKLHEAKVTHFDIKFENMLHCPTGIVLSDFGLSEFSDHPSYDIKGTSIFQLGFLSKNFSIYRINDCIHIVDIFAAFMNIYSLHLIVKYIKSLTVEEQNEINGQTDLNTEGLFEKRLKTLEITGKTYETILIDAYIYEIKYLFRMNNNIVKDLKPLNISNNVLEALNNFKAYEFKKFYKQEEIYPERLRDRVTALFESETVFFTA